MVLYWGILWGQACGGWPLEVGLWVLSPCLASGLRRSHQPPRCELAVLKCPALWMELTLPPFFHDMMNIVVWNCEPSQVFLPSIASVEYFVTMIVLMPCVFFTNVSFQVLPISTTSAPKPLLSCLDYYTSIPLASHPWTPYFRLPSLFTYPVTAMLAFCPSLQLSPHPSPTESAQNDLGLLLYWRSVNTLVSFPTQERKQLWKRDPAN